MDLDHPDIEEYIGWKLSEEEKVSALVAGSAALQKHCNAVLGACWDGDELSLDPNANPALKSAMIKAIQASVPQPHLQRMLDLAKHGWKSVEFDVMDTDWQGEAYGTVSGQNSNNSVRGPEEFMEAVKSGGEWDLFFRTEKEKAANEFKNAWNGGKKLSDIPSGRGILTSLISTTKPRTAAEITHTASFIFFRSSCFYGFVLI